MNHPIFSKKSFLSISVFLFVIFVFTPVYFGHFAFHNDYRIWEYDHTNFWFGYPESQHLFSIGRPLGMLLLNLQLMPIQTMHGVWLNQLLNVAAIGFLAVCCFLFFQRHIRIERFSAILLSILLVSLPSMTINAIWLTNLVPCIIPLFFALAAQSLMQRSHPAYVQAGLLLLLALLIYPPATLFFTTLTFAKFIFGPLDPTQVSLKRIAKELFLVVSLCIIYFLFIKLLKSFLLATHFAGIDWTGVYGGIDHSLSQYRLELNLDLLDKLAQIKNYLIFVFSAWFPLLSWTTVLGVMSGFLFFILYALQSNVYLSLLKNPVKTLVGIGLMLILMGITALPLLAGPAVYPVNYRVTFASMAIIPITLVFMMNQLLNKKDASKWLVGLISLCLCFFVAAESASQFRLSRVVTRLTQEYEKIKSTIDIKMGKHIQTINIQRPVVLEDPFWLNADFGLDATSYVMVGQIKQILAERHQDLKDYKLNYGSEFLPDPHAILISKAEGITPAPQITQKNIQGTWYYFGNLTTITYGKQKLLITNEFKMSSPFIIKHGTLLYVPDWNCTATLSKNRQVLYWDNGTVWTRSKVPK